MITVINEEFLNNLLKKTEGPTHLTVSCAYLYQIVCLAKAGLRVETEQKLTKREQFAAMALQGMCADIPQIYSSTQMVTDAVSFADRLIKELEKCRTPSA